jgi:hypothetical protein
MDQLSLLDSTRALLPVLKMYRPPQALLRASGGGAGSLAGVRRGARGRVRGGAAAQPPVGAWRHVVWWRGHTSADDEWLRAEELTHCPEKVAEHDATAPRRRAARRTDPTAEPAAAPPATPPPAPPPLVPPAGFWLAASSEVRAGAALVGQVVLYRWPVEGWVRGTVAGRSQAAGFSHVVLYGRTSALGSAVVPLLLDAASHGPAGRWVLLRVRRVSR